MTFILEPPVGMYSSGNVATRLHPVVPSRASPAVPVPATFKKSLRVIVRSIPSSSKPASVACAAAHSKAKFRPFTRATETVGRFSGHVGLEGLGELGDGRQLPGVLVLHVLDELLLGGEEHLRVVLLLLAQSGATAALVVVTGVDQEIIGQTLEGVVEGMVLPRGVAVRQVGPAAGTYEQRVGGEDPARQHHRDQVFGVSRRVQELQGQTVAQP